MQFVKRRLQMLLVVLSPEGNMEYTVCCIVQISLYDLAKAASLYAFPFTIS